jgi:hypothetical protein
VFLDKVSILLARHVSHSAQHVEHGLVLHSRLDDGGEQLQQSAGYCLVPRLLRQGDERGALLDNIAYVIGVGPGGCGWTDGG